MSLTDRDRKILIAIIPLVVIAAYWFLLLAPKREEASKAATNLAKQERRLATAKANAGSADVAKSDFRSDYAQIVRLGKAIPAQVDMPSLLVQLDAAANGTDIEFMKIVTGERAPVVTASAETTPGAAAEGTPVEAGGDAAQSAPGQAGESANDAAATANQTNAAAEQSGVDPADTQTSTSSGGGLPVGGAAGTDAATGTSGTAPGGLETVPLELEFEGNFFDLADFFHKFKRFVRVSNQNVTVSGRLVTVDAVKWSSDAEIFPHVRAELKATIYLSPKAEGVTAGADPTGPALGAAGPTPAGTTPQPSSIPTATATP